MKNIAYLFLMFLCGFFSCEEKAKVTLTNQSSVPVTDKRMVVRRAELPDLGNAYMVLTSQGVTIPIQYDDLDGDGAWDELVFEYSLGANESVDLEYSVVAELPTFEIKTDAYLGYSSARDDQFQSVVSNSRPSDHVAMSTPYLYQYEGPAWESELVAFRTYFDSRNGKDIFGKTKPQIYAEYIGLGEDYHHLQDWGMDVLKVGSSLGAGALALLRNDSLYRLGATETADFRIVVEGPVRSIVELKYGGWSVAGDTLGLTETIEIWAGKRSYQSSVSLLGGTPSDTLVAGIVDLKEVPESEFQQSDYQIMYTYGAQSENHDLLGMGILVNNKNFAGFSVAPKEGDGVVDTYLAFLKPVGSVYAFSFYAGWELENKAFSTREGYEAALVEEANALSQEVTFKIKNNE